MKFSKMQGLGNDFVVIDCFDKKIEDPNGAAIKLLDRRFGIGGDGLILAQPSDKEDAFMGFYNRDGSTGEMCGNGIRCLGKFLWDKGLVKKNPMRIDTLAGVKVLDLRIEEDLATELTVDMGEPSLDPAIIPVAGESNEVIVELDGKQVRFFGVSMGNPHAVTFDIYPEGEDFLRLGAMLECHPVFPKKANIEFCRMRDDGSVDMKVYERGVGPTLACGTGACATFVTAYTKGFVKARESIIHLPGGDLHIRWDENNHLFMTGPAAESFAGETALI